MMEYLYYSTDISHIDIDISPKPKEEVYCIFNKELYKLESIVATRLKVGNCSCLATSIVDILKWKK